MQKNSRKNKVYSAELKLQAVQDYLTGQGSLRYICRKYHILSKTQLLNWISCYNGHKGFKGRSNARGDSYMTKGRTTTQEERVEIVAFCIEHGKDYALTVKTYQISYQQIYSWVRKYEANGVDGLVDRRGKAKLEEKFTETDRLRQENRILQAKLKDKEMEIALLKKTEGAERRRLVSGVRLEDFYVAIRYLYETEKYPIRKLCAALSINRSSYYKWLKRKPSINQLENEKVTGWIKELYEEQNGILGYRQMTITINRVYKVCYNKKRIHRLMQILGLKSVCRIKKKSYIPSTPKTEAENILNREFYADAPNQKWLTDVTEFKYYVGQEVKKLYLSAILDLYDKRIVAYKIGDWNNNHLVFSNFDEAVSFNSDAHPLFHSDRGFQYTSRTFYMKLQAAKMRQSMSRVGHCIDNGPMESFWGMLKSEMYYLRRFTDRDKLIQAIDAYIYFYNNSRFQKRLNCMTPMEFHYAYAV